jgi:polyisoprenoid-binding protein YceI
VRTRILVVATVGLVGVALVAGGVYVYFFSGLRTSPAQLGLSAKPTAGTSPTPATSSGTPSAGLAGNWIVTSGSLAGYRVKELFVGQSSQHEAVGRTSMVSGGLAVSGDSSGYQVSALTLTVGLADLRSVDQVAGRDVTQRDGVVSRQLDVQQFPTATFTSASALVPAGFGSGQVAVSVTGSLTVHGVTKDVTVKAKAQQIGNRVEIAGSISVNMADFQVSPPLAPFVTVDSAVTIEFDVFLTKAA